MRRIVDALAPVVHAQVARTLLRSKGARSRDVRQDVKDFVQHVFVVLLENEGRVLRQWDPARGRSLTSFVALVAEREVISSLRSERRNPWTETPAEGTTLDAEPHGMPGPEKIVASREALTALVDILEARLDARGLELFYLLLVDERPTEDICEAMGMTRDAVYAWHTRLRRLLRQIAEESGEGASALVQGGT